MFLVFDTETSGLPLRNQPLDHPGQPHIVQLAAILVDEGGHERASLSVIVEPDGWVIPDAAAAVHGITTEIAMHCGVPLSAAIWPFICLRSQASVTIAHNHDFDASLIEIALHRMPARASGYHPGPGKSFCTMVAATPVLNLPPTERMVAAGFNKPKPPKLTECVKHFFGEDLAGAHDALTDVRACWRVYQHLRTLSEAA